MKTCSKCKANKNESEFNIKLKDGQNLQPHCRECSNKNSRLYYQQNKEHHKTIVAARKITNKGLLRDTIITAKDKPCADCGVKYPHFVMDFDHRIRNDKSYTISQMPTRNISLATLLSEIDKCDVVCANCHRTRTFLYKK